MANLWETRRRRGAGTRGRYFESGKKFPRKLCSSYTSIILILKRLSRFVFIFFFHSPEEKLSHLSSEKICRSLFFRFRFSATRVVRYSRFRGGNETVWLFPVRLERRRSKVRVSGDNNNTKFPYNTVKFSARVVHSELTESSPAVLALR